MSETLTSPTPPDKNTEISQQLDLTAEQGWNGEQLDLTGEKGWTEAQPIGQDSAEYHKLEFDVEDKAADAEADTSELVTVRRTSGEVESDWSVGGVLSNGKDRLVRVYRPTEDGKNLVKDISLDDFRSLNPDYDLRPKMAEGPVEDTPVQPMEERPNVPEQPTPEDYRRIQQEAKEYFNYFDNPQLVAEMRGHVSELEAATKEAMLKQFKELGIDEQGMEEVVTQKINEAMAAAREKRIVELAAAAFPYREDESKRKANKARERLTKLLEMPEQQYSALEKDWQVHEINKAHEQALKDDKSYKVGEQRRLARDEIAKLDEKYDGTLAEISRLPLDRAPGGQTHSTLEAYTARQKKIMAAKSELVDPELAADVSRAQAIRDLETQLRQKYQGEGLNEEQIQARLDESKAALDTWLKNIDGRGLPLADLQRFENQRNKERMLNAKRQKVREYLASTLLPRTIRGIFQVESEAKAPAELNLKEILAKGIDHNGSHTRAGGDALLGGGGESLWRKTVSNLELARNLARNEGKLMQGLIYLTLVQRGVEGSLPAIWKAIPEKTKKEARRKFMLGMAVTGRAILRASIKAAEKSRQTAAVGASAAAIKIGSMGEN